MNSSKFSKPRQIVPGSPLGELGEEVGPGLYEQELHFLRNTEWACNADDVTRDLTLQR